MLRETDETNHQISLEEYFEDLVKPNLFAVSRVFAAARKQMTLAEYKTFTYALASIKWTEVCPEVIYLDKQKVADIIGLKCDSSDLSQHLKRAIGDMHKHSSLEFAEKDKKEWVDGNFIITVAYLKNRVRLRINPDFKGLFGELESNYITLWSGDIYKMHTERAVKFYELLRENSDTRLDVNEGTVGIKKFKELFDIPKEGKGSYMRTGKNGGFNRTAFEQYVIDPVCADLAHTEMITLILQANGKYYEKVKKGNRVIAYKFFWTLSLRPAVASATDVKKIQERVDKNPKVLKIAKDLANGNKKKKPKKKATGFSNFSNTRKKDYDELQKQLIRKSIAEHRITEMEKKVENSADNDNNIDPLPW